MSNEYQAMAANAVCHSMGMIQDAWQQAAHALTTPHVLYKPRLARDGDMWCALLGADIQEGVCGFGKSPSEAMHEFDKAWYRKIGSTPV